MTSDAAHTDPRTGLQDGQRSITSSRPQSNASSVPPAVSGGQENADRAAESAPGPQVPGEDPEARQDQLLDEAVEETFPASDPIAPKQITR